MLKRMVWIVVLGVLVVACRPKVPPSPVATVDISLSPVPTTELVVPVATSTLQVTPAPVTSGGVGTPPAVVGLPPRVIAERQANGIVILPLTNLQPGHKYQLRVTSTAGAIEFTGTWSESAVGADGLPGVKTGLLEGKTPMTFDIVPPVAAVARNWAYSASASSKTLGPIALAIVDLTPGAAGAGGTPGAGGGLLPGSGTPGAGGGLLPGSGTPGAGGGLLPGSGTPGASAAGGGVVVVQEEGQPMAIINLTKLTPGRKYRLIVTSKMGVVAFAGTWSESAVGADGLPGAKTGLLEGNTPMTFEIVPPMANVARDWAYSASVSNKALGSITATLVQVTP